MTNQKSGLREPLIGIIFAFIVWYSAPVNAKAPRNVNSPELMPAVIDMIPEKPEPLSSPGIEINVDPNSPSEEKFNSISVSGDLVGMYYIEHITPPVDTETGILPGANIEAITLLGGRWMIRGAMDADFGQTKYVGATQSGTPTTATTNDYIFDGQILTGPVFNIQPNIRVIPYAGFGYHYWVRAIGGYGGYTEDYLFFYVPMGVRLSLHTSDTFTVSFDGAFLINIGGSIQATLPGSLPATGTLGSSVGGRLEVPMLFRLSDSFSLNLCPFVEYFGIGAGNPFPTYSTSGTPQGSFGEPSSSTLFYGTRAGFTYAF